MATGVRGQFAGFGEIFCQTVEHAILRIDGGLILSVGFRRVERREQGEDVGRVRGGIPVNDLLDARFDFDGQMLSGFVAGVADEAVAEIAFFEECNIDESHSAGAVAEDEKVSGELEL